MNPDNIDIENDIEKQDHEQLIIKIIKITKIS